VTGENKIVNILYGQINVDYYLMTYTLLYIDQVSSIKIGNMYISLCVVNAYYLKIVRF